MMARGPLKGGRGVKKGASLRLSVDTEAALPTVPAGRFECVTSLAEHRRSRVVVAEDRLLGSRVALKIMKDADPVRARARLLREVRALERGRHPNVVEPLAYGLAEDIGPFMATPYLEGRTLAALVDEHGALPLDWARLVLAQLAAALAFVHESGGAHGDVSPANVLCVGFTSFAEPPQVRLLDFGASSWSDDPSDEREAQGTTAYLAPERIRTGLPSAAGDVYSWGVVAYEVLAGVPPFRAATSAELTWLHEHETVRSLRSVGVVLPAAFEEIVLKALAKAPVDRFATASEIVARLDAARRGRAHGETVKREVREPAVDHDLRATLLARVRAYWLEGVLERATDGVILVKQALVYRSARDGTEVHPGASAPAGLVQAFEAHGRSLILAGEPGFGKTVNLLRLARHLVDRASAAEEGTERIPVVFTLSSWNPAAGRLEDWMESELRTKYQLTGRDAKTLVAQRAFVPLFDGLDDVEERWRGRCARMLNELAAAQPEVGLLVTCRTGELSALEPTLEMRATLELRPLDQGDVARQLRGVAHLPLRTALQEDPVLADLSSTPMLLHVMRVGLRDSSVFRSSLDSRAQAIGAVLAAFVEEAIGNGDELRGTVEETRGTMRAIATLLERTGRTVLYLEEADPSWLATRRDRVWYSILSRSLVAGLVGASSILAIGLSPLDNQGLPMSLGFACLLAGTMAVVLGLGFGLSAAWRRPPGQAAPSRLVSAARGLGAGLSTGSAIGAVMFAVYPYPMAFLIGLEAGLIGAGVMALGRYKCVVSGRDIVPVESLGWSWRNLDPKSVTALLAFTGAFYALFRHFEEARSCVYASAAILLVGLAVLGHRSRDLQMRATPNAGIRRSAHNAAVSGALAFSAMTLLFGVSYGLEYGACVGLSIGTVTSLCFGGTDVAHHYVARLLLARRSLVPLRVAAHLEGAVAVGLVRRVGSGFMFMHSMLQKHLAQEKVSS